MKRIISIVLVLSLILISGCKGSGGENLNELLTLGQKYLMEENYEEAVIAFEKAIEIDEKCVNAYLGLADAYVGKRDLDKALAALEKGFELTEDEALNEKYRSLISENINIDSFQSIDESLSQQCEQAIALYQSGKYEETEQYIATQIADVLALDRENSDNRLFFGKTNRFGVPEGVVLCLYGKDVKWSTFAYIGDFKNGMRSGKGLACFHTDHAHGYFIGGWTGDLQEGSGEEFRYQTVESSNSSGETWTEDRIILVKGEFKNGMANGEYARGDLEPGNLKYKFNCIDGVPQSMGKTTTGWWIVKDELAIGGYPWETLEDEIMCYASEDWINWEEAWHVHAGLRCKGCEIYNGMHPWLGYLDEESSNFCSLYSD